MSKASVQAATKNEDGYYEIFNAGQLYWFAALTNGKLEGIAQDASANAILKNDIIVNTGVIVNGALASNTSGFRKWTPIGNYNANGHVNYNGTFDGKGHTISGLYMLSSLLCSGFIGGNNSTVTNLTIADSYFWSEANHLGAIVGYLNEGTIENCAAVNCVVIGLLSCVGGVVGCNKRGRVKNCISQNCTVQGNLAVGGVVGYNNNGTLTNCFYLTGCATDGNGTVQFGAGNQSKGSTTADVAGQTEGKTKDQFKSGEVAYLLQAANGDTLVWGQTSNVDGATPILTSNEDYRVLPVKSGGAIVNYSVLKKGETNDDGQIDITDYQNLVNIALSDNNEKVFADKYDINGDGVLDVEDCTVAQKNGMSVSDYNELLEKVEDFEGMCYMKNADFDSDGVVDVIDIALIERMLSGHRVVVK